MKRNLMRNVELLGGLALFLCFICTSCHLNAKDSHKIEELQDLIEELQQNVRLAHSQLSARQKELIGYEKGAEPVEEFASEWVLQISGGQKVAEKIAAENNMKLVGMLKGIKDAYVFREIQDAPKEEHFRKRSETVKTLDQYEQVEWAEHQRIRRRVKRGGHSNKVEIDSLFNDPQWPKQWYLHDTRDQPDLPKLDLHVIGAWKLGFNGSGVVVSVLDDGIQHNHTDLKHNYDPRASYDLNDDDEDPMPQFDDNNKHGTRCAGEIGMQANNGKCGVGVAFAAKVGGIRMLDGPITDRLEAEALQYNIDHVDVFSASWGPNDDGKTVEGPGRLAAQAMRNGIEKGRDGKGTIYVWASGNGGHYQDDCNCDGYTDSIYTFSVSSAAQTGRFPWYGEKCPSTLASTYSSGAYTDQKIATTDLVDSCTTDHTGTSAAAPLAAGIVALALHANADLTWRDVQHIAVWTSEPAPLMLNDGWHKNDRGLLANIRFGFGLLNAEAFVKAARDWKNVPEQQHCTTVLPNFRKTTIRMDSPTVIRFHTDACKGRVRYMENVQLVADIDYTRRGNLAIWLTSPKGTRTKLLSPRRRDDSTDGFQRWPFMSVHTWGEDPEGDWQLEVHDRHAHSTEHNQGSINNITLIVYGTKDAPQHYSNPKQYDMEYNLVHDRSLRNDRFFELHNQAERTSNKLLARFKRSSVKAMSSDEVDRLLSHSEQALEAHEELFEHKWRRNMTETSDNTHVYSRTVAV